MMKPLPDPSRGAADSSLGYRRERGGQVVARARRGFHAHDSGVDPRGDRCEIGARHELTHRRAVSRRARDEMVSGRSSWAAGLGGSALVGIGGRVPATTSPRRKLTTAVRVTKAPAWRDIAEGNGRPAGRSASRVLHYKGQKRGLIEFLHAERARLLELAPRILARRPATSSCAEPMRRPCPPSRSMASGGGLARHRLQRSGQHERLPAERSRRPAAGAGSSSTRTPAAASRSSNAWLRGSSRNARTDAATTPPTSGTRSSLRPSPHAGASANRKARASARAPPSPT